MRERRALSALAEGHSIEEAAQIAGLSQAAMHTRLARGAMRTKFLHLLAKAGVTDARLAEKFNELLDAKETKWNRKTEKWDEFPDSTVQLQAARTIAEVKGYFPEAKEPSVTLVKIVSPLAHALEQVGHELQQKEITITVNREE